MRKYLERGCFSPAPAAQLNDGASLACSSRLPPSESRPPHQTAVICYLFIRGPGGTLYKSQSVSDKSPPCLLRRKCHPPSLIGSLALPQTPAYDFGSHGGIRLFLPSPGHLDSVTLHSFKNKGLSRIPAAVSWAVLVWRLSDRCLRWSFVSTLNMNVPEEPQVQNQVPFRERKIPTFV